MSTDLIFENAQLKGRVITLDAEVKCLEAVIRAHERVDCLSVTSLKKQLVEIEADYARLQAEVERLTKAGDAMAEQLWPKCGCQECEEIIDCWLDAKRAAKEGKQS
jgi:hypothetical protein